MADRITDSEALAGLRLVTMPMGVAEVVTIYGSLYGGEVFSPAENIITAGIAANMLDKGTRRRDKFAVSELLESVGAQLSFSSDDYRVSFFARCLQTDVPLIIELLAEQLREPAFHRRDLASLKKRLQGQLQRRNESTDYRAGASFSRLLYPASHPNYVTPMDEQLAHIEAVADSGLRSFHRKHYGLGSLQLVATGDVERGVLEENLVKHFGGWQQRELSPPALPARGGDRDLPSEEIITMADKTSVDLIMGQALDIDREHPDYLPLSIGAYVLGGNFSARLMTTVRDEAGLTYGVGSSLSGADEGKDGYWSIHGSFAPELLAKGKEAVLAQLDRWVEGGVTEEELAVKKTTLRGSFAVGLATTSGMAAAILDILERGKEIAYIDEYVDEIEALTLDQVNGAIGRYVHPEKLLVVAAGSIDSRGKPLAKG